MSVFIELRCEDSCEPHADRVYSTESNEVSQCWSHDNNGAGQMTLNATKKALFETYDAVIESAKSEGWVVINKQWICPHCAKHRA